jgi:hypothetical protein
MRVKVIISIALAVLLIVSSVGATAGYISTQGQPQLKTTLQGIFAYPTFGQQNTGSLQQIKDIYQDMLDTSKDMYDNHGSDLASKGTVNIPFLSGNSLPGPMDLISAMAPAGYAGNTSRLGNHSMKNNLLGTSLF